MPLKTELLRRRGLPAKALSYRVPMAVTKLHAHPGGSTYPLCPRCDRCLDREYLHFCNCCGQKLSWQKLETAMVCR